MASPPQDPHQRARRLARLIVSDLTLYHKEKIVQGIRDDTLFELLAQELEEGRAYYEKNADPAVVAQADYFNQAVVDILIKGRGDTPSQIW